MNKTHNCPSFWKKENGSFEELAPNAKKYLLDVFKPLLVVENNGNLFAATGGCLTISEASSDDQSGLKAVAWIPPVTPCSLGDTAFKAKHGLKYACAAGAMAGGITSVEMVIAMGEAGMLAFFGSAGLPLESIEEAIDKIQNHVNKIPYGFNLIHSPGESRLEMETVKLYLKKGVNRICAAAFMNMTPSIVYFRAKGMHRDENGGIIAPNSVFGKISRVEVAEKFFSPAPEKILKQLVDEGLLTSDEAELASRMPVAEDVTAEADSGGHTDNRPAIALFPTIMALKEKIEKKYAYQTPLRAGLAGGIATPESAAAAFSMGAAYIMTGSINQACVESGTSDIVREMLSTTGQADVTMAPSADMFELGVKVQVLKRGTMFAQRAAKLYELYRSHESYDDIPEDQKSIIEEKFLKCSFKEAWAKTSEFFSKRDPRQNERAAKDPKHKMALVFRSYLGQSSKWAISGDPQRKMDYQIWCGPSMGAFNEWVSGSFLEDWRKREVALLAKNLLLGAAFITRSTWLRYQGILLPSEVTRFHPVSPEEISKFF